MNINKLRRSTLLVVIAIGAIGLSACTGTTDVKPPSSPSPAPSLPASPAPSASVSPAGTAANADSLVGRWPGVEGTYLNISKKGEGYSVEIANLDGPKTYEGKAKGDTIEFNRNGKTETIRASSGVETGMKNFEKETNCVVVTKGSEGFCKK
jgi:hypothetical protein